MIHAENLPDIEKKYGLTSLDDYSAVTFKKVGGLHYVVAFSDAEQLKDIAHEVVHLKNYIYSDCSIQLDRNNDEPEAYLTGWLFDEIYKFLNPKKHV
jgi:hypothetical protein